jgi:hypothetical protein
LSVGTNEYLEPVASEIAVTSPLNIFPGNASTLIRNSRVMMLERYLSMAMRMAKKSVQSRCWSFSQTRLSIQSWLVPMLMIQVFNGRPIRFSTRYKLSHKARLQKRLMVY